MFGGIPRWFRPRRNGPFMLLWGKLKDFSSGRGETDVIFFYRNGGPSTRNYMCKCIYTCIYIYIQQKDSHPKKSWQFLFRRFLNDIWWWIWNLDHKQCVWRFVDRHDWQSTRGVSWDVTLHFTQDPWSMDCRGLPRGRESTFFLHGWDNRNIDCRI